MAVYYVIFERDSSGESLPEPNFESAKVLASPQIATVAKVEAESVAEAQRTVEHFFPGDISNTPVVVTEAQYKES
jgi:phosphatidate phosphatase APP1